MIALMRVAAVAAVILLTAAGQQAFESHPPAAGIQESKPAWVEAYMEAMIGTWIADNDAYRSEREPFDRYGIQWTWGIGKQSLVGRLYGIRDGRETGAFWEFREFWHPGEKQLLASQFGTDGTFGIGPHHRQTDGTMEMVQIFYAPDGTARREGHRSTLDGSELVTRSYDITADGTWNARRRYVWRKKPD